MVELPVSAVNWKRYFFKVSFVYSAQKETFRFCFVLLLPKCLSWITYCWLHVTLFLALRNHWDHFSGNGFKTTACTVNLKTISLSFTLPSCLYGHQHNCTRTPVKRRTQSVISPSLQPGRRGGISSWSAVIELTCELKAPLAVE